MSPEPRIQAATDAARQIICQFFVDRKDTSHTDMACEICECARTLKMSMSQFYSDGLGRAEALYAISRVVGFDIHATYVSNTHSVMDGHITRNNGPTNIVEVKVEAGARGAKPWFQALYYYYYFMTTQNLIKDGYLLLLCFIGRVVGLWIFFAGAVFTTRVTSEVFCSSMMDFHIMSLRTTLLAWR